ncbi:hypothetical protein ACFX13_004243 [Malus domestica]
MMRRLGSSEGWIWLIMVFITSVSYSFKINGEPVGYVQPKRGIQQGDPITPFLFVICSEGLSALLTKEGCEGRINGVRVCRDAPMIHYLLFANGSFLFARGTLEECGNIKRALKTYEMLMLPIAGRALRQQGMLYTKVLKLSVPGLVEMSKCCGCGYGELRFLERSNPETIDHILRDSDFVAVVWLAGLGLRVREALVTSFRA